MKPTGGDPTFNPTPMGISRTSASLGRSTSPGPPPYRTAKNVRDDVPKRHEGSANSKSGSITTGTNH